MTFEKAKLKTGEPRLDYIRRRAAEGIDPKAILAEINSPELHAGGAKYTAVMVSSALKGLTPPPVAPEPAAHAAKADPVPVVEPQPGVIRTIDPDAPPDEARTLTVAGEDLLTEDEKATLRELARAEIRKELRESEKKAFITKAKEEIRREMAIEAGTNEPMVTLTMNLAPYIDRVHLDIPYGTLYLHGRTYTVPRRIAQVLMEQMHRSWKHEDVRKGVKLAEYRSRETMISMRTGAATGVAGLPGF